MKIADNKVIKFLLGRHEGKIKKTKEDKTFSFNESTMELVVGAVLAVLSAIFFMFVIPRQIVYIPDVFPSPRTFPLVITGALFILSLALFASGWLKRKKENLQVFTISLNGLKMVGLTLLSMVVYVIVLPIFGYVISTVSLAIFLTFAYGQRNIILSVALAIIIPILTYLSFTNLLFIRLP